MNLQVCERCGSPHCNYPHCPDIKAIYGFAPEDTAHGMSSMLALLRTLNSKNPDQLSHAELVDFVKGLVVHGCGVYERMGVVPERMAEYLHPDVRWE